MEEKKENFSKPIIEEKSALQKDQIKNYEFKQIRDLQAEQYQQVKNRLGALAATDPEKNSPTIKDQRFTLSPMVRNLLAIEQEERARIEERVQEGIQKLTVEAQKTGTQQGFDEGFKKGHEQAMAQFRDESLKQAENLTSMVTEMEGIKQKIFSDYERFFIELIFKISKKVLLNDLSTDPTYLSRLCTELLSHLEIRENIRILIHPAESATLLGLKKELEAKFLDLKNFSVETSQQVVRGGCLVETDWNTIDARIETQLDSIHTALMSESQKSASAHAPTGEST